MKFKCLFSLALLFGALPLVQASQNYNFFEEEQGLFSLEYANHLEIKRYDEIYFLQDLKTKEVVWQIFQNQERFNFSRLEFTCQKQKDLEVCYSKKYDVQDILNLELFVDANYNLEVMAQAFQQQKLLDIEEFDRFAHFSRAKALKTILKMAYPNEDFAKYHRQCFLDVGEIHKDARYICFAKEKGIVRGIGDRFYPESSINLWGILQYLFRAYEVQDYDFDESVFDAVEFSELPVIHAAYDVIAKALYEGIFTNIDSQTIWPNRSVRLGEALQIISNFQRWHQGRQLHNYNNKSEQFDAGGVLIKDQSFVFDLKEDDNFDMERASKAKLLRQGSEIGIYALTKGQIYEQILSVSDEVKSVWVIFDSEKLKHKIKILYSDDTEQIYKLKIKLKQFMPIKQEYIVQGSAKSKELLEERRLMPNDNIAEPDLNLVPNLKIYLANSDLEAIFINRTDNKRYKAFLEIVYPDGNIQSRSILIKTRGNANRGYIKSSFTIESFLGFEENENFKGDEFLDKGDEFKLRSFIDDESMVREKIFYTTFKKMGYPAPDFFEGTLEINGIPMGFYQITEPIKKDFFKRRGINTKNYFYAQNSGSIYNTNLQFHQDRQTTLSQYKIRGDEQKLLSFIQGLDVLDPSLLNQIDLQNVFDYSLIVFLTHAYDSLTHNFYVYFDEDDQKWHIFPWDGDACLKNMPEFKMSKFMEFTYEHEKHFNNLIYYTFQKLSKAQLKEFVSSFCQRWNTKVSLIGIIEYYEKRYKDYFVFDNELWNKKFIERKKAYFDTPKAIEKLKELIRGKG